MEAGVLLAGILGTAGIAEQRKPALFNTQPRVALYFTYGSVSRSPVLFRRQINPPQVISVSPGDFSCLSRFGNYLLFAYKIGNHSARYFLDAMNSDLLNKFSG